ncbi:unnamed protein product [Toxocara canis]|uniref:Nuclear pore protein n=1 Tax=Toxocara canis TaxID=6265 RepID=A0A183UVA7_TOXCA|nr:unnamed protein product [Toxocara canis]
MAGTFEDILHRADRLSSTVLSSVSPVDRSSNVAEMSAQSCMDEFFRRSESLWKKKQPVNERRTKLQSNLLLGQRSLWLDPGPSCSFRKTAVEETLSETVELAPIQSMEEILPDMLHQTVKLIKLDAERAFFNRCAIEDEMSDAKEPVLADRTAGTPSPKKRAGVSRLPQVSATAVELAFAKALSEYVLDKKQDGLAEGFKKAASRSRDESITSLWEQGVAMLTLHTARLDHDLSPRALRSSAEWMNALVEGSLRYLQKHFMTHMRELVNRNLSIARIGGVPGTLTLVDGYLNVKRLHPAKRSCQDGVYGMNGHAIWEVVYHCFRCGDYESVAEIAQSRLQNLPSLSVEDRDRVKAEWKAVAGSTVDVYKKAVYCALLGGDVAEVCDNLENWLWLKIAPYKFTLPVSPASFATLQRTVSIEYGEEYFTNSGGSAAIFFQALLLTGQFERAIHFLYRSDMLVHAVHLAIMAHINGLLITSANGTAPILEVNEKDQLECSLNFSRLVLIYVKPFECVDVERAMDYYFCLRTFESPTGGNMFYACVSRAVYLGGDMDKVVGRVDEHGLRHEGLIDKYADDVSINDAIAKVAANVELSAEPVNAVHLYHCAERYNDALRVLCDCLVNAIKGYREMEEPLHVAIWLGGIYKRNAVEGCSLQLLATLYLLIDLSIFFTDFQKENYLVCLDIIAKLKCIPLDMAEVSAFVSTFHSLSDEVRSVLPDVCVTVMRILEQLSANSDWKGELSARADAIVAYAARVPHTFPAEITSQILDINSRLH